LRKLTSLKEVRLYRNKFFGIFFISLIVLTSGQQPEDLTFGIVLLGMFIRVWAAGYLIKRKQLTTWGPYSYTRNPLYLGTFVIGIGLCIVQRSILFLIIYAALFIFVYYFQIQHEEATLGEKFGEDFREYCRNVPRFFPRLTPYSKTGSDKTRRFSLSYMWKNKGGETIGQVVGVFLVLDIKEYIILPFLFNKESLGQLIVNYFRHFM